jgi:hypothetical protein
VCDLEEWKPHQDCYNAGLGGTRLEALQGQARCVRGGKMNDRLSRGSTARGRKPDLRDEAINTRPWLRPVGCGVSLREQAKMQGCRCSFSSKQALLLPVPCSPPLATGVIRPLSARRRTCVVATQSKLGRICD